MPLSPEQSPSKLSPGRAGAPASLSACSTISRQQLHASPGSYLLAMPLQCRSSPYSLMILPSSPSGHVLTSCSAVSLAEGPMRMSRGPGRVKLKPRSARSSCSRRGGRQEHMGWASRAHQGCKKLVPCSTPCCKTWKQFALASSPSCCTAAAVDRSKGARTLRAEAMLCLIWLQMAGDCWLPDLGKHPEGMFCQHISKSTMKRGAGSRFGAC